MSDRAFVDTNILVYAHDSSAGAKNEKARDALIIQAATASGADILYSEDFSNGQMYGSVRVVNPLAV